LVIATPDGVGAAARVATLGAMTQLPNTSTNSARRMMPTSKPIGRYRAAPWRSCAKSMSSIMTTKRNSTATAPT